MGNGRSRDWKKTSPRQNQNIPYKRGFDSDETSSSQNKEYLVH